MCTFFLFLFFYASSFWFLNSDAMLNCVWRKQIEQLQLHQLHSIFQKSMINNSHFERDSQTAVQCYWSVIRLFFTAFFQISISNYLNILCIHRTFDPFILFWSFSVWISDMLPSSNVFCLQCWTLTDIYCMLSNSSIGETGLKLKHIAYQDCSLRSNSNYKNN